MPLSRAKLVAGPEEVLLALEQASEEHDEWLRGLGSAWRAVWKQDEHPFLGLGAPAAEVTEVLVAGQTHHAAVSGFMRELGIRHWHADLRPFEYARRMSDALDAVTTYPSFSQVAQVVWALRRLKKRELVTHDRELGYWAITHDGDEALKRLA